MDRALADADALKLRDDACDGVIAAVAAQSDASAEEIAGFVRDLFEKYFAASQLKQEPPKVAAPKIAKIVSKQAQKKFARPPEVPTSAVPVPVPETPAAESVVRVTGKTAGVDRKILNILNEIASYYATPISIISGQRSQSQQANAMYANWQSHLRRGKDNASLARNEKLRLQLDALKQEKAKDRFLDLLMKKADWATLSRHVSGDEVDLAANTDPVIVAALATCLNHEAGRNSEGTRCHHFDNSKALWPIPELARAKWQPLPKG